MIIIIIGFCALFCLDDIAVSSKDHNDSLNICKELDELNINNKYEIYGHGGRYFLPIKIQIYSVVEKDDQEIIIEKVKELKKKYNTKKIKIIYYKNRDFDYYPNDKIMLQRKREEIIRKVTIN